MDSGKILATDRPEGLVAAKGAATLEDAFIAFLEEAGAGRPSVAEAPSRAAPALPAPRVQGPFHRGLGLGALYRQHPGFGRWPGVHFHVGGPQAWPSSPSGRGDGQTVRDQPSTAARKVQRIVVQTYHEHILIYCCEQPRKQVWQWAIRMPDGRKLRHREHPFFSDSPPASFLARISGLQFTLAEEENATLLRR